VLVFFVWLDARSFGWLVLPEKSASYHFYSALDLAWAHFAICAITAALALTATGYLWRPVYGWAQASLVALAAYAVQTVAGAAVMVRHIPEARAAWLASRSARGLPLHEDRVDAVLAPGALWTATWISLALMAVMAAAIWRHRAFPADGDA
jgi:hypothetical protein